MTIHTKKQTFLESLPEGELYYSTRITYESRLNVFLSFLEQDYDLNDSNYVGILEAVDSKSMVKAIDYYVLKSRIFFKGTVELYFNIIKSFFSFLEKEFDIYNVHFDSNKNHRELHEAVYQKIEELKLIKTEQKQPINQKEFDALLKKCNSILDTANIVEILEKKNERNHNPVKIYTSALIIKLIMFTGIKNQVLDTIKLKDYDMESSTIEISKFKIKLPERMNNQFQVFIELRKELVKNDDNSESPLFIMNNGVRLGKENTYAFKVLRDTNNTLQAESLAKYTIIQLLKKDTDINVLRDLTKFGDNTFLHCQELISAERAFENMEYHNEHIQSNIEKLYFFEEL